MSKLFFASIVILASLGCEDDGADARSIQQNLTGTVFNEDGGRLASVSIVVRVGEFGALTEVATVQTGANGAFSTPITATSGQQVLVSASVTGYADQHQRTVISGVGELSTSLVLSSAQPLSCLSGICSAEGIRIVGLPEGVAGSVRVFDPKDDIEAFPGDFDAIEGGGLESGGFAWIGMIDVDGNPLETLGSPAMMDLEFHRKSWPEVRDSTPGNGQIDVPFYAFDPKLGTWKQENGAVLIAASGEKLVEADVSKIRKGEFSQRIFARGEVGHFSYWNIDWPTSARSSTRVRFSSAVTQATLTGETYTGRSSGTPNPEGKGANTSVFCFDAPRSEATDEDIDQDGVVGETETGILFFQADGKFYGIPKIRLSEVSADCSNPQGEIIDIALTDADVLKVEMCAISGRIRDLDNLPVGSAVVQTRLSPLANEVRDELCGLDCLDGDLSDAAGMFTLNLPVAGVTKIQVSGYVVGPTDAIRSFRGGTLRIDGCPTGEIEVIAEKGSDHFDLEISQVDTQISWAPAVPASLIIIGPAGVPPKWEVFGPMASPATYGTVSGAATQHVPSDGTPPQEALSFGDNIFILGSGPGTGFYGRSYQGELDIQ